MNSSLTLAELLKQEDEQLDLILSNLASIQAVASSSEENNTSVLHKDLKQAIVYIEEHLKSNKTRAFMHYHELIPLIENIYVYIKVQSAKNPLISADLVHDSEILKKTAKGLKEIQQQILQIKSGI